MTDQNSEMEFVEYDPLARFGGNREEVREKLLVSGEIATLIEDKGIERADLARKCHIPEEELAAILDGSALNAKMGKLRRILDEAQSWIKAAPSPRAMRF